MQKEIQIEIEEAVEKSLQSRLKENLDKPIYESVATYDAGTFTRYIGG